MEKLTNKKITMDTEDKIEEVVNNDVTTEDEVTDTSVDDPTNDNEVKNIESSEVLEAEGEDIEMDDDFDFGEFEASTSTSSSKGAKKAGIISIINNVNGHRMSLSKLLMKKLNDPESVQFAFKGNEFIIAEKIPTGGNRFNISKTGKKNIIYARELVQEITDKYRLDFSNRTSLTLYKVKYKRVNGQVVAIIEMD